MGLNGRTSSTAAIAVTAAPIQSVFSDRLSSTFRRPSLSLTGDCAVTSSGSLSEKKGAARRRCAAPPSRTSDDKHLSRCSEKTGHTED